MAHTFTSLHYHIVFSTRERRNLIPQDTLHRLHGYLGGLVNNLNGQPIAIGGTPNHVHILATLRSSASLATVVGKIKSNSSKWAHDSFATMTDFAWQEGYSAFTVSRSQIERVKAYIAGQVEHHKTVTFDEEFERFCRKHGFDFDSPHV